MDIDQLLTNFFKKDVEEQDTILAEISHVYLRTCIERGMGYKQIIEEIDELIELYTETDFFERAEAFSIMKRELEQALLELVKEQKHENGL
jgi:predicted RNase H-like HicB family nuclease